jgi:hypothetical protein
VGNCQVAVSTALIADGMAWPTSLELYLPEDWVNDETRRIAARIPKTVSFREKWRIALAHVRTVLHADITIEAVVADSAYGQIAKFRTGLERLGLLYLLAVPYYLSAASDRRRGLGVGRRDCQDVATLGVATDHLGPRHQGPPRRAVRSPARAPGESRGERWLLCEESLTDGERKYYFSNRCERTSSGPPAPGWSARWDRGAGASDAAKDAGPGSRGGSPRVRVFVVHSEEREAYERAEREKAMQRVRAELEALEQRVAARKIRAPEKIGVAAARILARHHGRPFGSPRSIWVTASANDR